MKGRTNKMIFEENMDLSIFESYKINCEKCSGLCCVILYFTKSDGFPKNKEAGTPCQNLQCDYRCKIHSKLALQGLNGCMSYDCFGAGQHITQQLNLFPKWNTIGQEEADRIFDTYLAALKVHQTLWYLTQCMVLKLAQSEKEQASLLIKNGRKLLDQPFSKLEEINIQSFCENAASYLKHICSLYHSSKNANATNGQDKNYMGKNMKGKNLAGKDFTMSLFIAANLERSNLYGVNFLGADMRDTNIQNTDLSQCLFLTQIQINAAKGNSKTVLPPFLHKPKKWKNK